MSCPYEHICGGCSFRQQTKEQYQLEKEQRFHDILAVIPQQHIPWGKTVFIEDGERRRATFAFRFQKGHLIFGFNQRHSNELVDIRECPLLVKEISQNIVPLRQLLEDLCSVNSKPLKVKKKKLSQKGGQIKEGDVAVCYADNGLDIVLEFPEDLTLEHRMLLFEWGQGQSSVVRLSHRRKAFSQAEPILEKSKPYVTIADYPIYIPAGTFMQASRKGEENLIRLVLNYLGKTRGKIADLFCGMGTFSYPLSRLAGNKVFAVDSSADLLKGFQQSLNKNQIQNIEICERNLFKYPLSGEEVSPYDTVVFDPPRTGAPEQMQEIACLKLEQRPAKVIAVSCNPHSFVKDASLLLSADYTLQEVTLVDQFTYSNHCELVALFTLNS